MKKILGTTEEFQQLLATMPQIVFISDPQWNILYINERWYEYTGTSLSINLDNMFEFTHPDDIELILKSWKLAKSTETHWLQEYRLRRHDGVYHWHLGCSAPEKDAHGQIKRWIGTITDIEEQKKIEEILKITKESLEQKVTERTLELTQTNAFLDTVIENIPNMIFVKDAEHLKFVRFNRAGEDLIGIGREHLIGKSDYDLFPSDQAEAFQAKDRAVIAGKTLVDISEEPISTQTGMRTLHTKKLPVYDSAGVPRYLLGISEDVTELKKLEKERLLFIEERISKKEDERTSKRFKFLSEASAQLGSTLDYELTLINLTNLSVPAIADWCAVELLQPDGSLKQIAVAHQNPEKIKWAWELLGKYPPDPNATFGSANVVRTGRSEMLSEISFDLLKASAINQEHLNLLQSIGLRSCICAPIRARGKVLGALTLVTTEESKRSFTQTDLHLAEEIGERAGAAVENAQLYKEARNLNRIKDEFLATLSHELRTPLNVILGHAEILKSEYNDLDRAQIKSSVEAIFRNAKTQTGLIADLLDVSSIITGKVSYKPTQVVPADTVTNIVNSLQNTAEAKGIILVSDTSQSPEAVLADPTRLHQIIWNLISNAVKFTPQGGRVTVKVNRELSQWGIAVTDTGRGIDPDFLPYVFDRFRQEDSSTTRKYGGLGLGLSIVRHLVEMHGGIVQALSKGKDQGATFQITLPMTGQISKLNPDQKKEILVETLIEQKAKAELKNIKILLVEDSEDSRMLIKLILNRAGAYVVEAESANEARAKLASFTPDIIVSDVGMPEESGIEFIKALREKKSTAQNIPAIALTAYVRKEEKDTIVKAGFQTHVSKPVSSQLLLNEIQALLQKINFY
ncbi:MAG: PAS domain-containing protein [Bdellovibrio sp.]|nr:PAS domain-containing protein [Bdellovibrio sp.]